MEWKYRTVRAQPRLPPQHRLHNRGSKYVIGSIKDLKVGDTIQYETSSGTRTYSVSYVGTIEWTDWSYLNATRDNRITIITCLADQPTKRVCVQATEVYS